MSTSFDQTAKQPYSSINKNRPSARDGHVCFMYKNKMFIFGGDRHHMPFNDLFYLDLQIWENILKLYFKAIINELTKI